VKDFPQSEKLRLEKKLLGFYVSDHPLKSLRQSAQILAPINLSQLVISEEGALCAVVMLTNVKQVTTKRGVALYCNRKERPVKPGSGLSQTYSALGSLLDTNTRTIIWGKVGRQDEQIQLIVEDAEPDRNSTAGDGGTNSAAKQAPLSSITSRHFARILRREKLRFQ